MDPMARTYGKIDTTEVEDLWESGRPLMDILAEHDRRADMHLPANDNGPDWSTIRDHTPENLDGWLDGVEVPSRGFNGVRLVED